jgi:hypothetical protein
MATRSYGFAGSPSEIIRASVTRSLARTYDSTARNVYVTYDVEILPIFMNPERFVSV